MPSGVPKLGQSVEEEARQRREGQVLGVIRDETTLQGAPRETNTTWATESGAVVSVTEPPPPWELPGGEVAESDARRFVTVPPAWTVRWINPRVLDQLGWRDWQPVMASDPRVKVLVTTMVSPEGNIRRGGFAGDILAWMYTSWVESRRKRRAQETERLSASAVDRQEALRDEFQRGKFGPYLRLEGARHPSHTIADGRTMRD